MKFRYAAWLAPWLIAGAGCSAQIGGSQDMMGGSTGGTGGTGGNSSATGGNNPTTTGGNNPTTTGGGSVDNSSDCSPLDPLPRRLWRLSAAQYGNAVKDLLGLAAAPVLTNTGGVSDYAFFTDDSALVDDNFQYAVYQAAEAVMAQAAPSLTKLAGCTAGEAQLACAQRFAQDFGKKAFRRPLEATEVNALLAAYTEGSKQDFNTGISLMVEALIQSPSFLFRTELGPTSLVADASGKVPDTTLNPYEVASQLSLLFTDSIPDADMMLAADNGSLSTPDGIGAQIDRLLKTDVVKQNISRIVVDWFNIRQLEIKPKDASLLAGLDPTTLEDDLLNSTHQFVDQVLWTNSGTISDLVTSQQVFVNQRLAKVYGYSFTGQTDQFVAVNDAHRAGMLTQPSFIWSLSDPAVTSIVKRGKFIHDDVICQDPGPGPGALLNDPAIQAKLAMLPTELDKSQYRLSTQPCLGCHAQLDPYALVLQNFDPVGAWRTVADGVPIDPTGNFSTPLPKGPITGAIPFAEALVSNKVLTACAVQKISSYAIGRMIRTSATCEVETVHAAVEQGDGTMTSVLRQVALASFVRARSGGIQ